MSDKSYLTLGGGSKGAVEGQKSELGLWYDENKETFVYGYIDESGDLIEVKHPNALSPDGDDWL